jgi:hypothetical protein
MPAVFAQQPLFAAHHICCLFRTSRSPLCRPPRHFFWCQFVAGFGVLATQERLLIRHRRSFFSSAPAWFDPFGSRTTASAAVPVTTSLHSSVAQGLRGVLSSLSD